MRWDNPQPLLIDGWIIMDGSGGGYIALRIAPQTNRDNIVCAADAPTLRQRVASADGITPLQLVTRQRRGRGHLREVS